MLFTGEGRVFVEKINGMKTLRRRIRWSDGRMLIIS